MASEGTFTVLKMAGATYLVYIGVMAWRHAGASTLVRLDEGKAEPITAHLRLQPRVFDAAGNSASSTRGAGFQPFLRCSATTLVKIPPRT
jgi:threonine/homoserine/homoserine lactone efflux protein